MSERSVPGADEGAAVGSGISTSLDTVEAAYEAITRAQGSLGRASSPVELALVFFSPHHTSRVDELVAILLAESGAQTLLGCTTQAPVGEATEIEEESAVSVWLGSLPGMSVNAFDLSMQATPDGTAMVGFPLIAGSSSAALVMSDGFSFPTQALLASLNGDHPGLPVIGGQASGGSRPGEHVLVVNDKVRSSGAVGALLAGRPVTTVVSQGCRPIGDPYVITAGEGNQIWELAGRPALDRLRETLTALSDGERTRAMDNGIHIGIAIDERKPELEPGDFLVRSIMQANIQTGAIAAGDMIQVGQMVQFQLRDSASADLDLDMALKAAATQAASGALLFTCNGRGKRLFGEPDHDARSISDAFGSAAVGGMFCQGEIGPIGGRNFLHGFTASIALF